MSNANNGNTTKPQSPNEEQMVFIEHLEGPSCVIAIPGSGKTATVINKTAVIVNGHNSGKWPLPKTVMALTYTGSAAKELKQRALNLISPEYIERVKSGTFHGVWGNALKRVNSSLMTRKLAKERISNDYLIRSIECHFKSEWNTSMKERRDEIVACIKSARSRMFTPGGLQDIMLNDGQVLSAKTLLACISSYKQAMDHANLRDHEMTLEETLSFLQTKGQIERSGKESHRRTVFKLSNGRDLTWEDDLLIFIDFHHLMVDEAQDLDRVQLEIIILLHDLQVTVDIVGDDDQSIYAFRNGLGFAGMKEFITRTKARELLLQMNYRCKVEILQLANEVISQNDPERRIAKQLIGNKGWGGFKTTSLDEFEYESFELSRIATELSDQASSVGINPSPSVLILSKKKQLLGDLEVQLTQKGVIYNRIGGNSIWEDSPIVYVINFLNRLFHKDLSEETIYIETIQFLKNVKSKTNIIDASNIEYELRSVIMKCRTLLCSEASNQAEEIVLCIYSWFQSAIALMSYPEAPNSQMVRRLEMVGEVLVGSAAIMKFQNESPENIANADLDNSRQINTGLRGTLAQRLAVINNVREAVSGTTAKVHIMTMHASKGLEYDHVWIIGLCHENLPSYKNQKSDPLEEKIRLEEERRILYVGITRARDKVRLTWSKKSGYSKFSKDRRLSSFLFLLNETRPQPYFSAQQYKKPMSV